MADYLTPDQRRRIAGGLMAAQYDRATPEEGNVAQRHGLLPLATYDNGRTGLAFPGFVAEPVESFNRLLQNGYQGGTGDTQGVEDAFNVAGAAMLGGIAAPKPKPEPLIGYRGSPFEGGHTRNFYWASADKGMASDYALVPGNNKSPNHSPNVTPAEFRFKNPMTVDAKGDFWDYIRRDGTRTSTDGLADDALFAGHDGIIIKNVSDPIGRASEAPQTTIAALRPGTVYSPMTGELLFANGGRPGAATGAALGAIPDTPGIRAYHGSRGEIAGGVFDPAHSRDFGTHFGTQDQANYFGRMRGGREGGGAVYPVDLRFQNPLEIPHVFGWKPDNVARAAEQARPSLQGLSDDVQRAADTARQAPGFNSVLNYRDVVEAQKEALRQGLESRGVDGLQYRNQTLAEGEGMSYIPISRGTTYSATTGDLLYANGGRPGAATGAALGAPQSLSDPTLAEILRQYGLDVPARPASPRYRPGDA